MRTFLRRSAIGIGLALLSSAAFAAQLEEVQAFVGKFALYILALIAVAAAFYMYTMRSRDKRAAPLTRIFAESDTIHSVGPDTLVTECVQAMAT
ncbi:MAG TPA: hypothetical protein VIR61_08460, partial [Sulfuricaulis sp.]